MLCYFSISRAVPAHFIQKYSLYSVKRGSSARLACESFGSSPISIQWFRQDSKTKRAVLLSIPLFGTTEFDSSSFSEQVGASDGISRCVTQSNQNDPQSSFSLDTDDILSSPRFNAFQRDFPGPEERTIFELHIMATELNDSATYQCSISNEFGDDLRNMELTILGQKISCLLLCLSVGGLDLL